ncbi:MAG: ogr/Delta-like zinc finger family protein [Pseudomonadota bacterium]|nr:ogr/Delta-like zinc finger family protein [Pseudomonadota bacterium]
MSRRGPGMHCPHCRKAATARTSVELSATYREVTYQCRNLLCGHIWVSGLEALRTLSPAARPHPDITLPLSRHVHLPPPKSMDQLPLDLEHAA